MSDKWQNVSAGPRQVKDLNKAIGALRNEGRTQDELTGVIGGDEHTWVTMNLMGPVRPEVTALDEAIKAKHNGLITKDNVRAIIADYEAAMPKARESRPVEDNRRTPAEDAELKAAQSARDAEYTVQRDAQNAILTQVMAKAPAGAKALVYAEYRVDASDTQTDYFSSNTKRTVAIGWRHSSREDFRALRAAAAQFSETAELAADMTEHRENYSMGMGNYLSDHGWGKAGTGWIIRSAAVPCKHVQLTEDAIPDATAAPAAPSSAGGGVTVSPSSIGREGVVEIRFAERPDQAVIDALKARRFRWARTNRCWYGRDVEYANSLVAAASDAA